MKGFKVIKVIPVMVALLAMLVLPMMPAQATEGTVVSIPDATVKGGDTVTLDISITNVTDLAAADIWLVYDKGVVTVDSIADGDLGELTKSIDNTNGVAKMNWFSATAKTGSFTFASVTLHASTTSGSCPLDLQVQELTDKSLDPIPYTDDDGTFTVDATPPTVSSVTPTPTLLADAQVGADNFTVTINYFEAMDTGVEPAITFATTVDSTLTLASGSWSDSDTYVATYNVADAGVTVSNVDIVVAGARDVVGNAQSEYTESDAIDIDTQNPTVNISVSDPLINEADASLPFNVTAAFSEPMDTEVIPTCTFTPTLESTLISPTGAWSNGDTYTFSYIIADADIVKPGVDVSIGGGKDANGNLQSPDPTTASGKFDVDTLAPEVTIVSPADSAIAIVLDAMVSATFSEGIGEGVNFGDIAITPDPGGVIASITGNALNIAHSDFGYLTDYTVTIPSGAIKDLAQNPNAEYSWSFTTLPSLMEGDVTLDKYVSISDALAIAQYKAGLRELDTEQLKCADTTDDGEVTITDALHIAQWLVDHDQSLGVLAKPLWERADDEGITVLPVAKAA